MKTTTRNTRIANFGKVVRCFHADKDNSFNSRDYFGAVALILLPLNSSFLFYFVNDPPMERKNQASLSQNLLFSVRKGRNFEETRRVQACRFFLGIYLREQDE
jgi:hypothetical protein